MASVCPTCKRRIVASKATDKKLTQDLAKAQNSIGVLGRWIKRPEEPEDFRLACQMERQRLLRAMTDHRLLWAIYRRRDKSSGYALIQAAPIHVPESRPSLSLRVVRR